MVAHAAATAAAMTAAGAHMSAAGHRTEVSCGICGAAYRAAGNSNACGASFVTQFARTCSLLQPSMRRPPFLPVACIGVVVRPTRDVAVRVRLMSWLLLVVVCGAWCPSQRVSKWTELQRRRAVLSCVIGTTSDALREDSGAGMPARRHARGCLGC